MAATPQIAERTAALHDALAAVAASADGITFVRNISDDTPKLPNTLSVSFVGATSSVLLSLVRCAAGGLTVAVSSLQISDTVCASAGAACHSDHTAVSSVLKAMVCVRACVCMGCATLSRWRVFKALPLEQALGTIRFSLGHDLSDDDVARTARAVASVRCRCVCVCARESGVRR